jgi:hypothetical protein
MVFRDIRKQALRLTSRVPSVKLVKCDTITVRNSPTAVARYRCVVFRASLHNATLGGRRRGHRRRGGLSG